MSTYIKMKIPKPRIQGALAIGAGLLLMLVSSGSAAAGASMDNKFPWLVAGAFLLLLTVFNNALAIFSNTFRSYAQESMITFLVAFLSLGGLAYLFSGQSIFEAEAYRTIFVILLLAHFSLLSIAIMMRSAAEFMRAKDKELLAHENREDNA